MTIRPLPSPAAGGGSRAGSPARPLAAAGATFPSDRTGEYALWQRRFWEHTIRDERDFARHVDYIHINPLKHGLVTRVVHWPYASFHRYVRRGLLPWDWAGDAAIGEAGEPRD